MIYGIVAVATILLLVFAILRKSARESSLLRHNAQRFATCILEEQAPPPAVTRFLASRENCRPTNCWSFLLVPVRRRSAKHAVSSRKIFTPIPLVRNGGVTLPKSS